MTSDAEQRIHPPTPAQRARARAAGHVASSRDLSSAGILIGGLVTLMWYGGAVCRFLLAMTQQFLGGRAALAGDSGLFMDWWRDAVWGLAIVLLPLLAALAAVGIGAHWIQSGFVFLPGRVAPDLNRLNPASGWRRVFAMRNAAPLAFGIAKIIVVIGVAAASVHANAGALLGLMNLPPADAARSLMSILLEAMLLAAGALLLLALADYGYQRWQYERELQMTPRELRDEIKNQEGDPKLTARRRAVRRQLASQGGTTAIDRQHRV